MSVLPDARPGVESPLARSRRVAFVTPVVLLVVFGLVLGGQILLLVEDGQAVMRSQRVLGAAHQTLLQVTDQEVGARSYLLARDARFLASFDRATPRASFDQLRQLTADDPGQQGRLDGVRERYERWLAAVSPALQPGAVASADAIARDLGRMDGVREGMREAIEREDALLRERAASLAASTTRTGGLFVGLLVGSAALLAWLSRRQLSALAVVFEAALESERRAREVAALEEWIR
ncbi:MAG: hypothetical protein EOO75_14630, partial [Myxococcales bacterium]